MITIKRDKKLAPRTWNGGVRPDGTLTASVCCPNGHISSLSDHTIDDKGKVHPSLICPWPGCDFHEDVKLDGWNPVQNNAPEDGDAST